MNNLLRWVFAALLLASPLSAESLTVAAAANLAALEQPLKEAFAKANPGHSVEFTFGASGALVTQILNGAPYHALLAADRITAQKVVDQGLATGPVVTYALGRLIFLALKPVDLRLGLAVVLDPSVSQFALANPLIAPYGKATVEALTKAGVYDQTSGKRIVGQSVAQALQFTVTSTGFGFVSKSALASKELAGHQKEGKDWFEVDPSFYSPLEQGFVLLKLGESSTAGRAFAKFLRSPQAHKVFTSFGYGVP